MGLTGDCLPLPPAPSTRSCESLHDAYQYNASCAALAPHSKRGWRPINPNLKRQSYSPSARARVLARGLTIGTSE